jgi:hypothetical protein
MITIYVPKSSATSYIAVDHSNNTRTISTSSLSQLAAVGTDPGFMYDEKLQRKAFLRNSKVFCTVNSLTDLEKDYPELFI